MRYSNLIIISISLIILSCANGKGDKVLIDVNPISDYFQEHFTLSSIVPLETSDSLLISDIDRIIHIGKDYLILSKKDRIVFIVDGKSGKLKMKIKKFGNGPGEYNNILDIAYDESNNHIFIYSDNSKLLCYDTKGNFQYEKTVSEIFEHITFYDNNILFYNAMNGYSCSPYLLSILNMSTNKITNIGIQKDVNFPIRSKGLQLVNSKGIYFTAPLDFNIFKFNGENYISCMELNIPQDAFTHKYIRMATNSPMDFLSKTYEDEIIYSINSIRELESHFIFRTNLMELCFYPKNEKQPCVLTEEFTLWNLFKLTPSDYFPHDGDDNQLIFLLSANKWNDGLNSLDGLSTEWKNQISKMNIQYDDNPILLIFEENN